MLGHSAILSLNIHKAYALNCKISANREKCQISTDENGQKAGFFFTKKVLCHFEGFFIFFLPTLKKYSYICAIKIIYQQL